MKARIKATGEIVEVYESELMFLETTDNTPDYRTRLEHTYAGMAMQGLLSSGKLNIIMDNSDVLPEGIAIMSRDFAHALVEKYKKEE